MNVALISFHFSEYSFCLAKALAKKNSVLLVLNKNNAKKELNFKIIKENAGNIKIVLIDDCGLFNVKTIFNAIKIVKEVYCFSPDIIHYQESPKDYMMAALPFLFKYPSILTVHDHKPHTGQDSNIRKRILLYRKIMRNIANGLIVHGNLILQEAEAMYPGKVGSIYAIPHGPLGDDVVSEGCNFDWEIGNILFFGRIEEYKGLKYLLAATDKLNAKNIKFKAVIAGSGRDLEQYKDKIKHDSHFELLDKYIPNEEVPNLFKKANVIVLPYTDATQSGVVAMALKFGRPIVSTDVGSISEVVRHNYNGLLVQAKNATELAEAIEKLIIDQSLSELMAGNSLHIATHEITWPVIAKQTTTVYEKIINR